MKKLSEIATELSALISAESKDEDIEKIKSIQDSLAEHVKNEDTIAEENLTWKKKYIDLLKQVPVYQNAEPTKKEEPSNNLEDIVQEVLNKK